jgi:hypothetical protein
MHRSEIINHLIKQRGYKRYLEIGTALDETFPYIDAPSRVGVDPDPRTSASFHMMSDEFFQKVAPYCAPFDIIFIDGSHERTQVVRDVTNAMRFLNPFGAIVMHDCNPKSQVDASMMYSGTVWEAVVDLRVSFFEKNMDWKLKVVDTDCGCGVLTRGLPDTMYSTPHHLSLNDLENNRQGLIGLIGVSDFLMDY